MRNIPTQVTNCLPSELQEGLKEMTDREWDRVREIRLHLGQPATLWTDAGESVFSPHIVTEQDLTQVVELAARGSFHAVLPQLRQGFLTLQGGHRLGICGTVHLRDGAIHAIDPISSLNLRLARQVSEAGEDILVHLCPESGFRSTLILAPPGAGKTTLLRNVIKALSEQNYRIGLADERGEVAAMVGGVPQLNVGDHTDVLEGCPKAQGLMLLLRGMNPQVLAVDEVTAPEDIAAMQTAFGCGVELLATAHGRSREDLARRPIYRQLLETEMFQRLATIHMEDGRRRYEVEELV